MTLRSLWPGRRLAVVAVSLGGLMLLLAWWLLGGSDGRGPGHGGDTPEPTGPPLLIGTGKLRGDEAPGEPSGAAPDRLPCVVLRDLGTGGPVAGVPVLIRVNGMPGESTSDDAGSVCWAASGELESAEIQSSYWTQATTAAEEIRSTGTMWLYGPLRLRLACEDELGREIPVREVEARLAVLQPQGSGLDRVEDPPWSMDWFRTHGIRRDVKLRLKSTGEVARDLPRLRFLGVRARTRTRHSDLVELPVPAASAPRVPVLPVRLRLVPMPRITGRARTPDGSPVAGALVQVNVFQDVPMRDADPTRVGDPYGGMTIAGHADGSATVKLAWDVLTDEDGAYELILPKRGRSVVQVLKPGFVPHRSRIEIRDDEGTYDAELLPDGDRPGARLLWKGEPLPAQELMAGDLEDMREQTSYAVEISDTGFMRDGWLTHGRRYGLVFTLPKAAGGGRGRRFVVWDGTVAEVELFTQIDNLNDLR